MSNHKLRIDRKNFLRAGKEYPFEWKTPARVRLGNVDESQHLAFYYLDYKLENPEAPYTIQILVQEYGVVASLFFGNLPRVRTDKGLRKLLKSKDPRLTGEDQSWK